MRKFFIIIFATIFLSACDSWTEKEIDPIVPENGEAAEQVGIIIDKPDPGAEIVPPVTITGKARGGWYFEATFPIDLVDSNGLAIAQTYAEAQDDWMTEEYVPFKATIESYQVEEPQRGTLIFKKANPSGLPEYEEEVHMPVQLVKNEQLTLKVFFSNIEKNPNMIDCGKVHAVERKIPKTKAVARAALEELLKGPTQQEKAEGYLSSLGPGIEIQSLVIEDGTATVDFNEELEYQAGGSCKIGAMTEQIRQTLLQFNSVEEVVISVNGETEEVLQP